MKRRDVIHAGAAVAALAAGLAIPQGAALAQAKVVWKATDVQ